MKALKFTLSGRTAFFKKPEANSYYYFTYGHIHKVALSGMFGAILGYRGYGGSYEPGGKKRELSPGLPEFYEKLQGLSIAVVPQSKNGMFAKKMQSFNNSVGYASQEQGGNLIVKEQWLENPCWDIYVKMDSEESEKIAESLLQRKCVYQPYLGKNDHMADIKDADIIPLTENEEELVRIHSLVPAQGLEFDEDTDEMMETVFRYKEVLPVGLDPKSNFYLCEPFILTNIPAEADNIEVYTAAGINLVFH